MDWLYIHFPHLYGETWLPNFHGGQAIALIQAQQQNQLVIDLNPAARSRGIDIGMNLNTAFCLCPQLQVETPDEYRQQRALERVALIASHYSAWIGLDNSSGLYIEIASMQRLFGEARWLQKTLEKIFQQRGYSRIIAAAPNPKAARLFAKAGQQGCYNKRDLRKHLRDVPITSLDIGPKTEVRLSKLGIRHVHDLIKLPSGDLSYRIDSELALYLDQIMGRKNWLPKPFKLPERFIWSMDLEQEFDSLEPLRFFLAKGLQKFCAYLQKRSLAANELQLHLSHRQQPSSIIDIKLASLDNRAESWQYLLNATVDKHQLLAPVDGLKLIGLRFEVLSDQKLYLFKHLSHEYSLKKTQLLNRLSARLGLDSLHFLQLTTDPRPEYQTVYAEQAMKALPGFTLASNTPLFLSPQPQAVNQNQFCLKRGPVRLTTGWWDRHTVHRDYYVACDKNFSTQWLFLDSYGNWYQQGWFS